MGRTTSRARPSRTTIICFGVTAVIGVIFLYIFFTVLQLIFQETSSLTDALSVEHVRELERSPGTNPTYIPKIIHQTWINTTVPERWSTSQKSCLYYHPSYEYWLWTDSIARNFIKVHYPWFLNTFDSYPYPIQRVDAVRYFILYHYGGIYLDLDLVCHKPLDPLLAVPGWLRLTSPVGVSNDSMGFAKHHPFLKHLIYRLQKTAHTYIVPYATVMFSTGPMFISCAWIQWINKGFSRDEGRIYTLDPHSFESAFEEDRFFTSVGGSSWHGADADAIKAIISNLALIITLLGLGLMVYIGLVMCFRGRRQSNLPFISYICSMFGFLEKSGNKQNGGANVLPLSLKEEKFSK